MALESSWERSKNGAAELNRLVLQLVDLGFKSLLPITMQGNLSGQVKKYPLTD